MIMLERCVLPFPQFLFPDFRLDSTANIEEGEFDTRPHSISAYIRRYRPAFSTFY